MSCRRWVACLLSGCIGMASGCEAWATCNVSAVPVNFGLYNPLSGLPVVATGDVTVTCTVLVGLFESWTIALSTGNSGNYTTRQMANGGSNMSYNLYTSAAYSNVWGDGSGSTTLVNGGALLSIGTTSNDYVVYGRIPAGQDAAAGTFTDTIIVTLNY